MNEIIDILLKAIQDEPENPATITIKYLGESEETSTFHLTG
jgi:hypothetical protein